ncbi:hypothetical protein CAOG_05473 [Capsaspora owczarzaki ATCC 30864]|uniref:PA domain-containing protein n=1 Tax=Capsaspora owczarzaki (strain ATCC 30864) TaxID=595528 RepID=A0A0D2WTG0_CAPO3|nr:hypothetical protein CAOG_05473 [Capsaspora owczarzaki ATCC 30864]KJE94933.1 hypothetical protein CAOG_005473 [Capsaspora owczarzaki ATCC 30864]|eukprot:XP_004346146.1 hypothetical protein CAOG_05473 [Capsaspora owczarzaki ATCC 30864]
MLRLWLLSTVLLVACTALAAADLALLDMTRPTSSHSEDTDTFCFVYNPAFANLALRSETPTMAVVQATPADACTPLLGNATLLYAGRAVLVDRGNCTFGDKAKQIQEAGGLLVVVINTDDSAFVPGGNASVYAEVHIPVGMLASSDGRTLVAAVQAGSANLRVQVRTPSMPTIDPSFFVMCLIAMVTTVAATYWTNHEEREQLRLQRKRRIESAGDESDPLNSSDGARPASSQQRAQASLVRAAEHTSEASHLSLSLRNVLIFRSVRHHGQFC